MLAIGKDSILDAPTGFDRFQQVTVQLCCVVGIDASVDDEVSFELDVCVARVHIDAPRAVSRRWDFGLDFAFIGDESGVQSEVAEGDTDIAFGIAGVVAIQDVAEILDRGIGAFVGIYGLRLC